MPQEFQKLYRFQHRKRNRKFDEDVDDGTDENDISKHRNAWQEGQVFSEAYRDKHGRLREHSIRPDLLESPGRGSYGGRGTETGQSELPQGFSGDRPQLYTEDESDGSGDLSSASFGENMAANYSDYSDTSGNYPRFLGRFENERFEEEVRVDGEVRQDTLNSEFVDTRQRSINHPQNYLIDENAFQLHLRIPEELGSIRTEKKPDSSMFVSGQRSASVFRDYTSSPNACAVENTANRLDELNFNDEDFPPLSSSQSSSSPSTPPKPRPNIHSDSRFIPSTMRDNTRTLPAVSRGQSPLARDAIAPVGRGRGSSLFQLLQNMPRARLPRFEQTNEPSGGTRSTYGVGRDVHAFPTDEELFASPAITRVSDPDTVRGGTRV